MVAAITSTCSSETRWRRIRSSDGLVQGEFAADQREFGLRDHSARGDADGKKFSVEAGLPEMQKLAQSGKARRKIKLLPDEALQHRGMIWQAVENFGSRQAIAAQLNRKVAHWATLCSEP